MTFWPWQYSLWRMTKNKKSMMAQARYIGFYNLLWLIGNDLILGYTVANAVMGNQDIYQHLFSTWIKVICSLNLTANRNMLLVI